MAALQNTLQGHLGADDYDAGGFVEGLISASANGGPASLATLVHRLNTVETNLDTLTGSLSHRFSLKLNELQAANAIISGGGVGPNDTNVRDSENSITRLQFQINTLRASLGSLHEDLTATDGTVGDPATANSLDQFHRAHAIQKRLAAVEQTLSKTQALFESQPATFTVMEFKAALGDLRSLLATQIAETPENESLRDIIQGLLDLAPLFHGFVHFEPVYHDFVSALEKLIGVPT